VENRPHEYFVTEMDAYPDEDVQPLDVRIECATDNGHIILRAKSVMVQQLALGLTSRPRLATWTAEEIDRAIDQSVNVFPDLRDALPFLKEVQSRVNARIVRHEGRTPELAGATTDALNDIPRREKNWKSGSVGSKGRRRSAIIVKLAGRKRRHEGRIINRGPEHPRPMLSPGAASF
jgi:hypothetical protein